MDRYIKITPENNETRIVKVLENHLEEDCDSIKLKPKLVEHSDTLELKVKVEEDCDTLELKHNLEDDCDTLELMKLKVEEDCDTLELKPNVEEDFDTLELKSNVEENFDTVELKPNAEEDFDTVELKPNVEEDCDTLELKLKVEENCDTLELKPNVEEDCDTLEPKVEEDCDTLELNLKVEEDCELKPKVEETSTEYNKMRIVKVVVKRLEEDCDILELKTKVEEEATAQHCGPFYEVKQKNVTVTVIPTVNKQLSCSFEAAQKTDLTSRTKDHRGGNLFCCNQYPHRTAKECNMTTHTMRTGTNEKQFSCNLCPYIASRKGRLELHMNTHTGYVSDSVEKKHKCPSCNKMYKHKFILSRHQRYECGDRRPFLCSFCPYSCNQKQNLKLHVVNKHKDLCNFDQI